MKSYTVASVVAITITFIMSSKVLAVIKFELISEYLQPEDMSEINYSVDSSGYRLATVLIKDDQGHSLVLS